MRTLFTLSRCNRQFTHPNQFRHTEITAGPEERKAAWNGRSVRAKHIAAPAAPFGGAPPLMSGAPAGGSSLVQRLIAGGASSPVAPVSERQNTQVAGPILRGIPHPMSKHVSHERVADNSTKLHHPSQPNSLITSSKFKQRKRNCCKVEQS